MQLMDILIFYIIVIFLLSFLYNWIKISIFMWGADLKGSSFKRTIAYMIGKKELENLKD